MGVPGSASSSATSDSTSETPPESADPTGPVTSSTPFESGWPPWLQASDLPDGAAITVVRDGDLEEVMAAFGAVGDPVRPWDPSISTPDEYNYVEPWAAFADVPGGVVVVEPSSQGVNLEALEGASSGTLAMVVYWNVEMDAAVMVGENGALVGDIYRPEVGGGRFEELVGPPGVPTPADPWEAAAWGLRAQPALTGVELTSALWEQMSDDDSAYRLEPSA